MIQEFLQFVIQNWILSGLFLLLIIAIIWFETRTVVGGIVKIDGQDLVHLINRENATVVDIRDKGTFQEGHIIGAMNLPTAVVTEKTKKLQKLKNKVLVIVCPNGQASLKIAQQLKKEGFEKLYILKGGMAAWKSISLPLEKS